MVAIGLAATALIFLLGLAGWLVRMAERVVIGT